MVGSTNQLESISCETNKQFNPTGRLGLREFVNLIDNLDSKRIEAVASMGFGGLMKLKALQNHNHVAYELMRRFDVETCVLEVHGKRLKLTEVEVSRALGLPINGLDVQFIKCKISEMCGFYGLKSGILRRDLVADLESMDLDDNWRARFILFASDCILKPTSAHTVNREAIRAMKISNSLKEVNWCPFVLKGLKMGVKHLKAQLEKIDNEKPVGIHLYGCTYLLEIFYLEYLKDALPLPLLKERSLPRSTTWNDPERKKVLDWVKLQGGFDSPGVIIEEQEENLPGYSIEEATKHVPNQSLGARVESILEAMNSKLNDITYLLKDVPKQRVDFDNNPRLHSDDNTATDNLESNAKSQRKRGSDEAVIKVPIEISSHIDEINLLSKSHKMGHSRLKISTIGKAANSTYMQSRIKVAKKPKATRENTQFRCESAEVSVNSATPTIEFLEDPGDILNFIIKGHNPVLIRDHVFANRGVYAIQKEMQCLGPEREINNVVIDVVANILTEEQLQSQYGQMHWFLPVFFSNKVFQDQQHGTFDENWFVRTFRNGNFWTGKLSDVCNIFVPIHEKLPVEHWFLLVVDMLRDKATLIDSAPLQDQTNRIKKCRSILITLQKLFKTDAFKDATWYGRQDVSKFDIECPISKVQGNAFDCGIYVIQRMRLQAIYKSDLLQCYDTHKNASDLRSTIAHWIVCSDFNKVKKDVVRAAITWRSAQDRKELACEFRRRYDESD